MKFISLDSFFIPRLSFHLKKYLNTLNRGQFSSKTVSNLPALQLYPHDQNFYIPVRNHCVISSVVDFNVKSVFNSCSVCNTATVNNFAANFSKQSVRYVSFQAASYSINSPSLGIPDPLPILPSSLTDLSDDELLQLLCRISRPNNVHDQMQDSLHEKIILDINEECIRRAASWDFATFFDFLRRYSSPRVCSYRKSASFLLYAMNQRIDSALEAPLPTQLEYLRILNDAKVWFKLKRTRAKHKLKHSFSLHFDQLTWNDIDTFLEPLDIQHCILADDKLTKKLCRAIIKDFENVTNSILTHVFRLFHTQACYPRNFLFITPWLLHILDAFVNKIQSFNFECILCAGQLCTKMFIYDARLLQTIADILQQHLKDLPPFQVATAISVLTHFNFQFQSNSSQQQQLDWQQLQQSPDPSNLYTSILRSLEEESYFVQYKDKPRSLMHLLADLCVVGVYSHKYLDLIFSQPFQRQLLGHKLNRYRITPETLMLHGSSALECPSYAGSQLEPALFEVALKKRVLELPKVLHKHVEPIKNVSSVSMSSCLNAPRDISTFYRALYCTRGLLDELFGGIQYTHVCFLLPQFKRATIIFSLDSEGKPLEIAQQVRQKKIVGRQSLDAKLQWYAFVFKSRNIYSSTEPMLMGDEIAKERLLRQCGFKVVSITQHGWLNMSIEEKLNVLRNEISRVAGVELKVAVRSNT